MRSEGGAAYPRGNMHRVVITGGPGAGKTTLIHALAAAGYPTVEESARAIIAERLARGESPRPQQRAFALEILRRDKAKYRAASQHGSWTFFDRCVVEAIGYVHEVSPLAESKLSRLLESHAMHLTVFVLPPWPEIYRTDTERDQTFEEAARVYEGVKRWYTACGYRLHEVPPASAAERGAYIL